MEFPPFPCPCCGYLVFSGLPGSYDSCPIRGWEDDDVQLRWPGLYGGANRLSLEEAQTAFEKTGTSDPDRTPLRSQTVTKYDRDPQWRRLDRSRDEFAVADTDGWPKDKTELYYWRRPVRRFHS
jgi:hypothetical protein